MPTRAIPLRSLIVPFSASTMVEVRSQEATGVWPCIQTNMFTAIDDMMLQGLNRGQVPPTAVGSRDIFRKSKFAAKPASVAVRSMKILCIASWRCIPKGCLPREDLRMSLGFSGGFNRCRCRPSEILVCYNSTKGNGECPEIWSLGLFGGRQVTDSF